MSQSGTKVANAFVTVIPTMEGARQKISEAIIPAAQSTGSEGGKQLGGKLSEGLSTAKIAIANALGNIMSQAVSSAAGAIKDTFSAAFNNYANYEQLVGGVDTLFKESSNKVQQYAADAFRTAGLSANDYMEQVTGFSAALLNSLGGDTDRAADVANQAMIDMSDNANKMGTSMASIQYAYQGFAKQNYTMLDNLKLGYGGTQAEMARLINETGVMGDQFVATAKNINEVPFDKIIEGIHVVQERLGITGTTAAEAADTIEGSINSAKAAWNNLLVGLADPNADLRALAHNFAESVKTAVKNAAPAILEIVRGVFESMGALLEEAGFEGAEQAFSEFADNIGTSIKDIADFFGGTLVPAVKDFFTSAGPYLQQFGDFLGSNVLPAVMDFFGWLGRVGEALEQAFGSIGSSVMEKVEGHGGRIQEVFNGMPGLFEAIGEGIIAGIGWLGEHGDEIADIIIGIADAIDVVVGICQWMAETAGNSIAFIQGVFEDLSNWFQNDPLGQAISAMVQGNIEVVVGAFNMLAGTIESIVGVIVGIVTGDWSMMSDGVKTITDGMSYIVETIWNYMAGAIETIVRTVYNTVSGVFNALVDFISSIPGRIVDFFVNLPENIGNLFTQATELGEDAWNNFMSFVADLPGQIVDFFSHIPEWIGDIFSSIHVPTLHLEGEFNLDPAHFSLPRISFYGAGGFSQGETLVYGERGTELMWPSYEPYFSRYASGLAKYLDADGRGNTYLYIDGVEVNDDKAIEDKFLDAAYELARKRGQYLGK